MKIVAFAMFLSVLLFPVVTQAATVSGVPRVVDGDTLAFNGERVRIHGINAVESKQQCEQDGQRWACGQAATQAMSRAVGGAPVQCSGKERDAYGRLVAVCWNARGEDLGQRMVEEGGPRPTAATAWTTWRPKVRPRVTVWGFGPGSSRIRKATAMGVLPPRRLRQRLRPSWAS